jgi:hypothetical protein
LESRTLPSFLPPVGYAVGANPKAVAVADLTGNGIPDIVTANRYSADTVSVLLGNGDGSFQNAVDYPAGPYPNAVAVGDFNGDGRLDLAVADNYGGVSVLLNNGDGSFQAPVNYPAGIQPVDVAVGDFTGDGILDIVTANSYGRGVSVLLGNGDGTFRPPVNYYLGGEEPEPGGVAVGDFTGDGIADIAVSSYDSYLIEWHVDVLLAKGDGTFQYAHRYDGSMGGQLVAADLTGNGLLDLIDMGWGGAHILRGKGDGSFAPSKFYYTGGNYVAVADVNGDGIPDLLGSDTSGGTVNLLLGNGNGTFQPYDTYATGSQPKFLAAADLNGDGFPDFVTVNGDSTISVGLNDGNWGTAPRAASSQGSGAAPADFRAVGWASPATAATQAPVPEANLLCPFADAHCRQIGVVPDWTTDSGALWSADRSRAEEPTERPLSAGAVAASSEVGGSRPRVDERLGPRVVHPG